MTENKTSEEAVRAAHLLSPRCTGGTQDGPLMADAHTRYHSSGCEKAARIIGREAVAPAVAELTAWVRVIAELPNQNGVASEGLVSEARALLAKYGGTQ